MRYALALVALASVASGCQEGRSTGHVQIIGAPDNSGVMVRDDYTASAGDGAVRVTDASGEYKFDGDLPGEVTASAASTVEGTETWSSKYANAGYPDFTFTAAGSVTGRATLNAGPTGHAGISVTIGTQTVTTDDTGAFTMPAIATGTYPVSVIAIGYHEAEASVTVIYKERTLIPQVDLVTDAPGG